ncbi:Dolichyl-phosphate-mannose--protein mannosyltransferase 1 [Candida viswanathii]|uniref:Dolichyl-phosphate-mannose--protein mannosyltransferase n=1 Tax=Candida viswanathii TaxID=5486 RepID=A0A367YIL3_9ASCO|nr:Dolichyl-phosphate-mannose--protein mannosyltransferase 1 [Candida viswanathii]
MAKKVSTPASKVAAKQAAIRSKQHEDVLTIDPLVDPIFQKGHIRDPQKRLLSTKEYWMLSSLLVVAFYVRMYKLSYPNSVVFDEYILGTFFMDVHPPLAKMLFGAVGAVGGFKGDLISSQLSSHMPHFLLIIENFNVTISRYILLDSPLLFFIAAAVYAWKKFEIQVPFTFGWYKSLIATGIALGLALSSKWVGLFTVAWVGLLCLYQLWFIIGDLTVSTKKIVHHFFARGFILLGIPIALYLAFFAIHFQLLYKEGDGGAFMTSAFRASLQGNKIPKDIIEPVGLATTITLYPHLDSNNKWLIEPFNGTIYNDTFVPLINGMKIRLKHINTGRRLHSHDEKPPVSERDWQKEASCYGYEGFAGDANDDWIVEVVNYRSQEGDAQVFVKALNTVFRLKHAMTGHYLFSSEVKLPDWGFGQQEVTAASQGKRHLTHWYIETNENKYLPKENAKIVNYPKLLTSHHHWQSNPSEWPLLLRGINYWNREHRQVYLLGNAVTWWAATLSIAGFSLYAAYTDKHIFNFNTQVLSYTLGWAIHYAPFFLMGRQLFLHHYQPALYFGILALGHPYLQNIGYFLVAGTTVLSLIFYVYYSPLIYASPWTRDRCSGANKKLAKKEEHHDNDAELVQVKEPVKEEVAAKVEEVVKEVPAKKEAVKEP